MKAGFALPPAAPYRCGWRLTPLAVLLALAFASHAAPLGGQVSAGAARISANAGTTLIDQSSQRAIVDWRSFSIGAGETVRFQLPDAAAAVLNRVNGGELSAIQGRLLSNGRVFLLNPNGVVIGPTGVVRTAGFVASTRNVDNAQFMAGGPLTLAGDSPAVVRNLGVISATEGDAVLAAQRVENAGTIAARRGTVALVAGKEVWYAAGAATSIVVRSALDAGAGSTGVDNSGLIQAAQAELRSVGGNPWALAVRHTGVIEATTVLRQGGRVLLSGDAGAVQVAGTVRATGRTGGVIQVLGSDVALQDTARLDASGTQGGGTVLVGGDYQGRNPQVQNARTTSVAAGAQLRADAIERGSGGRVIVWADGKTDYAGALSARGGVQGGDGGFAEVSGKSVLRFAGSADLRAPRGKTGELLLDPTDITIGAGLVPPDPAAPVIPGCPGGTCSGAADSSFIAGETLAAALATANVTVTTASAGAGHGDIIIDALLCLVPSFNTANTLTLNAERDILVNGPVSVLGEGALTLLAGRNIRVAPDLDGLMFTALGSGIPVNHALTGGNGGLTVVAGRTDSTGTIAVGANSNLGTLGDDAGHVGSGAVRVFGTSAANTVLTGWDQAFRAPVTSGKSFGDAGTDGTGIYYSSGAPAPEPTPASTPTPEATTAPAPAPAPASDQGVVILTYGSGQLNFGLGQGTTITVDGSTFPQNWMHPEPFVPAALNGREMLDELMAMLGGEDGLKALRTLDDEGFGGPALLFNLPSMGVQYQQYFSPEVERTLYFVLAVYTQPPATQTDLATALVRVMQTIQDKKPFERTESEQQTLHDLSLAIEAGRRYGSEQKAWNDRAEAIRLENELEQLQTSVFALEQRIAQAEARTSGPLHGGLTSLWVADPADAEVATARKALADAQTRIQTVTATLRNLRASQGKLPATSDVDAMLKYLGRRGVSRLLAS